MPVIKRTAEAEEDLISIWLYISQNNPAAADRLLDEIEEACSLLANHPQLGPARPEIAEVCRSFPVGHYLILYRTIPKGIEVIRVSHGARRLDTLFSIR